jgi:hypothetical protein
MEVVTMADPTKIDLINQNSGLALATIFTAVKELLK